MPYNDEGIGHQGGITSMMAAHDLRPKAATVRAAVLAYLRKADSPKTSEEIAEALGIEYCTAQPRTSELRRDGKIEPSGVTKLGRYGKQIIAWQLLD